VVPAAIDREELVVSSSAPPRPIDRTERVVPASKVPRYGSGDEVEKQMALSRDGTLIAVSRHAPAISFERPARAAETNDEIRLWDMVTGSEVLAFDEPHRSGRMAISPDGQYLLSVGTEPNTERGEFKIWDLKTGKVKHRQQSAVERDAPIGFSPDSKSAYVLLGAGVRVDLGIFDVDSGVLDRLTVPLPDDQVSSVAISPVSDLAAIGVVVTRPGGRLGIDIHDLRRRKMIGNIVPTKPARQLTFSGDGRLLVGSLMGKIVAWETSNWTEVASYPAAKSLHDRLAVSADGRFVAALLNARIEILDLETMILSPLEVPYKCLDLAFSPGGTLIVAAEEVRFAFFDPATRKEQLTPRLKADA
jgi:WD40 repeat protein